MKKSMVFFALLTICFYAQAQINKGAMFVGASISANANRTNNSAPDTIVYNNANNYTSVGGVLSVGKFVSDNLLLGVFGGYQYSRSEFIVNPSNPGSALYRKSESTSYSYSGGAFMRTYKMLGKSHFAVYGQMNVSCGSWQTKVRNSNNLPSAYGFSDQNSFSINAALNPGIVYFFGKHFAVDATVGSVGCSWTKTKSTGSTITSSESTSVGLNSNFNINLSSISVGVNFYFGGGTATKDAITK
jgi:hypothetical protein